MEYLPIADYGIIGNLETVALVGKNGSIDWFSSPTTDSPSVFARILDVDCGGHWRIAPVGRFSGSQRYLENSNVLVTTFTTPNGSAEVIDFMPVAECGEPPEIIRWVQGLSGTVRMRFELRPAFDYGRQDCRIERRDKEVRFIDDDDSQGLVLRQSEDFSLDRRGASEFEIEARRSVIFNLCDIGKPNPSDPRSALKSTRNFWVGWVHNCEMSKCPVRGPWHELTVRSSLALKLLTHKDSGSIAAAPTTSLPESTDGDRNWDYRFAWLRDSVFTIQALLSLGYLSEAEEFMNWLVDLCGATDPEHLAIMHKLHPFAQLGEEVLGHLSGYRGIKPVRIGNAASGQRQNDIYGELLRGVGLYADLGGTIDDRTWAIVSRIVDHVVNIWHLPDAGIWEIRGDYRHYVYSKVMCWAAVDQGIKLAEKLSLSNARLSVWKETRDRIKSAVLEHGYSLWRRTFVQSFGSTSLDAANLLIPMTGFLPWDDSRVFNTVQATVDELATEGLVRRYNGDDDLQGREGVFLACSFWLVDCLVGVGQIDDAVAYFKKITGLANHLGLFAEEYDLEGKEFLGNFPQAFTHIALIHSAVAVTEASAKRVRKS